VRKPKSTRNNGHAPCRPGVSHRVYCPVCPPSIAGNPQTVPHISVGAKLPRVATFSCGHSVQVTGSAYR
jgi:hypothetical protein